MYNGCQTYEEVQRRFYGSKSFFVNMGLEDFVDKIGARKARATRKASVLWPIWEFDFKTGFDFFEELGIPCKEKMRGIRAVASHLLYPWITFNHLKAEDFAAALKTIRHLAMGGLRTSDKIPEQLVQVCFLRVHLTYFVHWPRALFNA
jgi:hypothetical protein